VENVENSQEDSRATVATMTVTTAPQTGGVANGEGGESRKTAEPFGVPTIPVSNRFLRGLATPIGPRAPT
jgi:hypothetical protein